MQSVDDIARRVKYMGKECSEKNLDQSLARTLLMGLSHGNRIPLIFYFQTPEARRSVTK
jgi:hypothetical protein